MTPDSVQGLQFRGHANLWVRSPVDDLHDTLSTTVESTVTVGLRVTRLGLRVQ